MAKKTKRTPKAASAPAKKRSRVARAARGTASLFLRTVLFTVMLVLLLGAGAWLAVLKTVNAQQISEVLTQRLQQLFDRPVIISSLDLKFLNTLELKGFAVLDSEVHPGAPFLSAESVTIRYQLLPLLDHQLVVDEITLNRPRIDVVRSPDGIYNVPPVRTAQTQNTYVVQSTGQKLEVHVEDWSIKDGVLSYQDLKNGVSHAIYNLNMHFDKLHFDELSPFSMDTVLRNRWGDNVSDLEIRGKGQINFANFHWDQFSLRDFKTQVAVFRKPVDLTVDMDNLRRPSFSLQASVPAFDQQDLSVFAGDLPSFSVPTTRVTARGQLDEGYTRLTLEEAEVKNDLGQASASGLLDFTAAPFSTDVKLKSGWVDLAKLSKRWPALKKFKLTGKGSVAASVLRENGKYTLPLVELGAQGAAGTFWGFKAADVSGQFVAKQDFTDLYAKTTSGRVQVANTLFDKLVLTGSYRKGHVYAYIASALLNEVPLKMRLSIQNIKSKKRKIDTSIDLQTFDPMKFIAVVQDFADVIQAIPKKPSKSAPLPGGELAWLRNFRDRLPTFMPNFSGTLYADRFTSAVLSGKNFNAEFAFTGLLPGAANLDGTLDMKLEDGIIYQMEKLAEEQQALNVTFTPFIMMHRMESSGSFKVGEVLKDVAFTEMAASVDFKKGTMIINNAFTQGPVISAAVSGWTDWVRETFELVIWTMFTSSSRRGILAENLTDESGNPALAFKVSASMLKPKLEMLRAKKTQAQITAAQKRGLRTEFTKSRDFRKGEFNAKK